VLQTTSWRWRYVGIVAAGPVWKLESRKGKPSFKMERCCCPCRTGCLKVVLLSFYSRSVETPTSLRPPTDRKMNSEELQKLYQLLSTMLIVANCCK
jgi:hypothetical protein